MADPTRLPLAERAAPDTHNLAGNHRVPCSVVELIAAQAARTPDRIAVIWQDGAAWTYAELMHKVDAIARQLHAHGVAPGDLVGVGVPRRPEMLAAVLGVMRAGAAYVALDPAFPAARLQYMVEHAGIRHVLVWRTDDAPAALADGRQLIALDGIANDSAPDIALPTPDGGDLAYVLYTSGSTGQPKGVRILHRNLANFLVSMREAPGIDASDVLCAVTTLSFDIAALELFLPLLVGARIVIASEDEQQDPAAFATLLHQHGVTMLQTTPTLLRLLLGSGRAHEIRGMKLLIGGEAMPRDIAESMLPVCGELWNMYGPTETTVWSTIHRVQHGDGAVPLGTPITATTIYILDEQLAPRTNGEVGEIWIGGAGVADGYYKDPARTAERFLPDPFAMNGSRMYRTGDLGSLRDGVLHFHGRADDQIKLRGYRIEPGDIEAAALSDPDVEQAVAIARDIVDGDKRLLLYLVVVPGSAPLPRLRAALRERLPAYMRPQHIEILAALPRTPNGKVDRKALPLPKALAHPDAHASTAADGLESVLTSIWCELLQVNEIGRHDDFFDLGGDSLLAVRAFERMQASTGINLPLATLLMAPTIAEQTVAFRAAGARELASCGVAKADDPWTPLVPIQPHGTRPPLFCMHAIGGNVLNYAPLARELGDDQPVYGLQAQGLDGITPPMDSLPEMAARYVREIRALQPHGPYFLAGGSMGGKIAYEMARQLHGAGESIGLLAMMDTYGPGHRYGDAGKFVLTLPHLVTALFARARRCVDALRVRNARTRGRPLPHALRYREIARAHYRALCSYQPPPFEGKAVLFRAAEQPFTKTGHETLGWSGHVLGGIKVIDLPGDHSHLIEQPELPTHLRALLARSQQAAAA